MKDVLISLDEGLWGRMKVQAAKEGRPTKDVVASAFRGYLTWGAGGSDGAEGETGSVREAEAERVTDPKPGGRKTLAELVAEGTITTGAALVGRETDPGKARALARKLRERQDRIRSHPEEASQDPGDVPEGFEEEEER